MMYGGLDAFGLGGQRWRLGHCTLGSSPIVWSPSFAKAWPIAFVVDGPSFMVFGIGIAHGSLRGPCLELLPLSNFTWAFSWAPEKTTEGQGWYDQRQVAPILSQSTNLV